MSRDRVLALVGILLVGLNLRAAVVSLSPIADRIAVDLPLGPVVLGLLGAAPPIGFVLAGLVTPRLARRIGAEHALLVGIGLMALGQLLRAVAPATAVLVAASLVAFLGIGAANVLLPSLVRRSFPTRIGSLTGGYIVVQSLAATAAPLVAVPVAIAAGWRVSIGMWGVVALLAAVPWAAELLARRGREPIGPGVVADPEPALAGGMRRSRSAWAMAAAFTSTAAITYIVFAQLPTMLRAIAHVDELQAGALLAVFSLGGLPLALVLPPLAARLRSALLPLAAGGALFAAGFLGLLLAPTFSPLLWTVLVALGPAYFPFSLALVAARSRTHAGNVGLSGFMQGIGYVGGAAGPLLAGVLHAVTGGWTAVLVLLLVLLVPYVPAAIVLGRPGTVEDEIAASRAARRGAPAPPPR